MGIVFGLAILIGVQAGTGAVADVLVVSGVFGIVAILARAEPRRLCLYAATGCMLGGVASLRVIEATPPPLTTEPAGTIHGQIISDPQVSASGQFVTLRWHDDVGVRRESMSFLPAAPRIGKGDRIELRGTVHGVPDERILGDAVRVTRRAGWLEMQRREIRDYLTNVTQRYVPGTPGALTLGLLTGDDSALTVAERDQLRRAGLSHLTAVSGWNVTLVTSAVGLALLRLGLRSWGWSLLQLVALVGFVWIVGPEPPVTRAAIMAVVGLAALRLGRPAHSVSALVLSAAIMAAVSPGILTSLSFQLSVLATFGLVLAARICSRFDGWQGIALAPLVSTSVIGLMTAPILAAEFGTLSLLTVPANIIAAPIVPIAAVAGIIVVATSPVPFLAGMVGWVAAILSGSILWLARWLSAVPYAFHQFAPLGHAAKTTMYAGMLVVALLLLPEGRLLAQRFIDWIRLEPTGAAISAAATCTALMLAAVVV